MELDIGNGAAAAARAARTTLAHAARGTGVDEPRMAKIASVAIFEEAMLGALHARLGELRTVTK